MRRGERIDHYETIRRRKDGSLIEISLCVSPVRNRDGRVIGAPKIARDITAAAEGDTVPSVQGNAHCCWTSIILLRVGRIVRRRTCASRQCEN
ncbi:PAS domain-containing protein [Pararhizobium sp. LjRoot255]